MTTDALPQWSDGMLRHLDLRPRLVFLAALVFILVGAVVFGAPLPAGVILGGTSGWLLWFGGVTLLAVWLILLLGGRPLRGVLIAGVVAAASGAFLFYNPRTGALAVAILVISTLVMDGGVQLALALKLRPAGAWRWLFASALASVIAAIALSGGAFVGATPGWGPLVGTALISSGLALLLFGRAAARRIAAHHAD
ncbi:MULTISPECIES: hypothetical protein [unclassified Brevundimonas]|uniref:hypothetical protein n=1 Tax=unclassified Brevundimonas TaxID=2622653 RepID=UPI000A9FBB11|nr:MULTISPECIES: hypothetical protein [unclassified Brevundimonas]